MPVTTRTSRRSPLRRPPLHPSAPLHRRFKGVRQRDGGRWVSEIRIPHSRHKVWLGSFPTAEHAARAYDTAYLLLRRPAISSSCLNFSDSLLLITPRLAEYTSGHVLSNRTIQKAAAAIANTIAAETHNLSAAQLPANVASREAVQPPMITSLEKNTSSEELSKGEAASLQGFDSEEYRWITDLMSPLGSPREKAGSSSSFLSVTAESPSFFSAAAASFDQLHQGVRSSSCSNGDQQLTAGSCHAAIHDHQHGLQEGLQRVRSSICRSLDQTHLPAGGCKAAANNNHQQGPRVRAEGAVSLSCRICACTSLGQQLTAESWNGGAPGRDDLIEQALQEGLGSSRRVQGAPDLEYMSLDDEQLMSASCCYWEEAYLQEGLLKDGFTAMSPAVTTKGRFDVEVTGDTHIAPLWIYRC